MDLKPSNLLLHKFFPNRNPVLKAGKENTFWRIEKYSFKGTVNVILSDPLASISGVECLIQYSILKHFVWSRMNIYLI